MELFETLHGTKRLTLDRSKITKFAPLCIALEAFSIWGGADASDEHTISWEFDKNIPNEVIRIAVQRLGYSV